MMEIIKTEADPSPLENLIEIVTKLSFKHGEIQAVGFLSIQLAEKFKELENRIEELENAIKEK